MKDTVKIDKTLEESGLIIKGISEAIKNEAKKQKARFFPMLLATLAASDVNFFCCVFSDFWTDFLL